jgi:hypothetical protein
MQQLAGCEHSFSSMQGLLRNWEALLAEEARKPVCHQQQQQQQPQQQPCAQAAAASSGAGQAHLAQQQQQPQAVCQHTEAAAGSSSGAGQAPLAQEQQQQPCAQAGCQHSHAAAGSSGAGKAPLAQQQQQQPPQGNAGQDGTAMKWKVVGLATPSEAAAVQALLNTEGLQGAASRAVEAAQQQDAAVREESVAYLFDKLPCRRAQTNQCHVNTI